MAKDIKKFDTVVLGGGPGGYVAAIRAAQLGMSTCVIDEQPLGGVCVNWGCIPSKALLKTAETYQDIKHLAPELGIQAEIKGLDWKRIIKRSREVSEKNSSGVEFLVKRGKIHRPDGRFRIIGDRTIEVLNKNDRRTVLETIQGEHVIIATGSVNRNLPGVEIDGKQIITYKEAMLQEKQPKDLIVIGAGAIGVEFAYFYAALGTKVTLIELLPQILPVEDADSSKAVALAFRKLGMDIHTSTTVEAVTKSGKQVVVKTKSDKGKNEFKGDLCLVAIGFQANLKDWNFESTGIALDKGYIKVDEFYRTDKSGYYAIGDVIGPPQLAHLASHEGIVCVESIAGKSPRPIDYTSVPGCTYCQPQVASVGYTEAKCKELGIKYKAGKFPFSASGKARAVGHTDGFVKLLFEEEFGGLIGAHIVGSEATEMISELCVAKALEATAESIFEVMHPHPTLSEAVMEAAAAAYGHAIHI
ncbi:dihydrolipoyl dehydrogenase [bacterium]|nr:dihydrolipoyl dehydrogenase [bacterium]MBU1636831.1 dihydrolipoyl dehydrogenase [bacterium]MBU1921168.1 dihydrolipoyl dehydrogenase [bacterium]